MLIPKYLKLYIYPFRTAPFSIRGSLLKRRILEQNQPLGVFGNQFSIFMAYPNWQASKPFLPKKEVAPVLLWQNSDNRFSLLILVFPISVYRPPVTNPDLLKADFRPLRPGPKVTTNLCPFFLFSLPARDGCINAYHHISYITRMVIYLNSHIPYRNVLVVYFVTIPMDKMNARIKVSISFCIQWIFMYFVPHRFYFSIAAVVVFLFVMPSSCESACIIC